MKWPTPYFTREEFACRCQCGLNTIDYETVMICHAIREHFDKPVTITSGVRCEAYNKAVGGAPSSQHLLGRAADIVVQDIDPMLVAELCDQLGVRGVGRYQTFTHVDSRSAYARW